MEKMVPGTPLQQKSTPPTWLIEGPFSDLTFTSAGAEADPGTETVTQNSEHSRYTTILLSVRATPDDHSPWVMISPNIFTIFVCVPLTPLSLFPAVLISTPGFNVRESVYIRSEKPPLVSVVFVVIVMSSALTKYGNMRNQQRNKQVIQVNFKNIFILLLLKHFVDISVLFPLYFLVTFKRRKYIKNFFIKISIKY
ncbi:MAG: hypothetical protein HUN05_05340 [Desulfobacter sp.]|nr:MAG: hypothetical protein HUN05_05340 [Desulfobacter sp.]